MSRMCLFFVVLGAVDVAVLLVGASWLAGGRQGQVGGTPGNLLAGVVSLGLFGGAELAGSLNGKHGLALTLPIAASALLCRGDDVFVCGVVFRASIFAGVLPPFFSPSASIGQNIKLGYILNLVHR